MKKGFMLSGVAVWFLIIGLGVFFILFNLADTFISTSEGVITGAQTFEGERAVRDFVALRSVYDHEATSTLALVDAYCYAEGEARKDLGKALRERSKMMFEPFFVSAQIVCSSGDELLLRDYICDKPDAYPLLARNGQAHELHYCNEPRRVTTHDDAEWVPYGPYRLQQLEKGERDFGAVAESDTITLKEFRERYADVS